MAGSLVGDDLARQTSSRRSWRSSSVRDMWNTQDVFRQSSRQQTVNEEEELKWAAIERLPTYDRMKRGMLRQYMSNGRVVAEEVDVAHLGDHDKKQLMESILKVVEDDNERFLKRLRARNDRVGIDIPKVEVRYQNISIEGDAYVGTRALPTLLNSTLNQLEGLIGLIGLSPSKKRVVKILHDVSGIVKPSRMTLLLGPPSSGKTTLLKALAGKLDRDIRVTGKVTYCGHEFNEFVPQRTSAYISQHDLHYGEMTVRETLDFSGRCLGVGTRYDMLVEMSRREKDSGVKPDPEIDAFMKATSMSGKETSLITDYVLKILGLDICADIMVGDGMRRGISGGQKKRVTTGEMLVGPAKAFFMDEISTGLDSSTTFQIIKFMRQMVHILDVTMVISLLQPAPETYDLFDDIILVSEGQIVYQGPRENVLEFFEYMGFRCPERKGVADFLQEVTSKKDQEQYWYKKNQAYRYVSVPDFVQAFRSFHVGQRLLEDLRVPYDKRAAHPAALVKEKYGISNMELFKACFAREVLLMKRSSFIYIFKTTQITIMATIAFTVFLRTTMKYGEEKDSARFWGALFFSLINVMFNGVGELSMTVFRLPVFFRQRDALFYPGWAFGLPIWITRIPISLAESFLWTAITYYTIGFAPAPSRFFKQFLAFFGIHQMAVSLFRFIAGLGRSEVVSGTLGSFSLLLVFILGGYIVAKDDIEPWMIWGYYVSPMMYGQNAIAINEFLDDRWSTPINNSRMPTVGKTLLKERGLYTEEYWYWICIGALFAFSVLFNVLFIASLTFLNPLGKVSLQGGMGFDNECILNIQSLAGEYFCPVCRLLVYPNEALQSQCTHLYCKPCLTYVVSSTRACPYDGYLVTEADAKPLIESNKSLAETIGKIAVHCLYHRSGCTWQGPLSECTSHCSGCAFGNSPVVCNRCGIQIVHRQVQEHAQNCPGVQPQAQQAEGALDTSASGTSATADQTQAATQSGIATSQAQVSQTTSVTAPGPDPNQKANSSSQAVVQAAVPSAEQWYQHQQQYQQYYQQYPGYDPYQQQYQNYYPYQQPAVPQSQQQHLQSHPPYGTVQHQSQTYLQSQPQTQPPLQPQLSQSQPQPQPQPQPQIQPPHVQAPVAAQTQNQAQVNQQQQLHPAVQTYPAAHGQPHPQPLPYFQAPTHSQPHPQHVQMPHNQQAQIQQHTQSQLLLQQHPISQPQPHSQPQQQAQLQQHPQPNPQLHPSQPMNATIQPQTQHPSSHAVTGNHLYPQPHLHQPVQSGAPQQRTMHVQSHGMPHSQSQTPVQIQSQFPQQPPLMRPPPSHTTIPNQQQPALLPSPGQIQNINPAQQQPVHSYGHPPGNAVHQRPHMQAVQQPTPQQYFHHQPFVQQQPPTQLRPQGQSHSFPQHIHASTQSQQNVALSQGIQHTQSNLGGRPMMPIHGVQSQTYAQTAGGVYMRPMHPAANLPSTNQDNMVRTNNLVQSGANSGPTMSERQAEQESELSAQQNAKKVVHDMGTASGVVADAEVKTAKSETDIKSIDNENKPTGDDKTNQGDASSKEIPDIHALENGESVSKSMMKEEGVDGTLDHSSNGKLGEVVAEGAKDVSSSDMKQRELKEIPSEEAQLREEQGRMLQKDASGNPQPFIGTVEGSQAVSTSAPISDQGKHLSHHGPTTIPQRPGAPLLLQVPPGPPHHTQGPGHHLRPPGPAHVPGQPFHSSEHFQPHGGNLGFGASSGRASQYGPQGSIELQSVTPHGPYNEGHLPFPPTSAFDSHGGMMSRAAPIGQPSGNHPNMLRMNGTPGLDSSSTHGPRDERFKAFPGERLNPFPVDPTHHVIDRVEFEDELKQFPRPSYMDSEPVAKFGNYSSRPFDRAPHGFKYDSGPHTDPAAGTAPSRFLSPYRLGGSVHGNDAGDFGRMEPTHGHPDFVGRRLVDGLAPRSPVRDYPGLPPHGFRGFGPDDFDGREFHRFGDPLGNQFHEGRFSSLPGHFRRGEFEGPGNLRMVDHRRNDFIGQDGHPGHLRRGDHLGPHNLREPLGFGSRHSRMGDMAGPGNFESFRGNRPSHPRLGEPGFRSSFSLQRFPNDGTYTGDLESFDHSRKRKPASMGWCRICKVDCETVEGLDLHSQTREHQKMAMDMVRSIKQNAKKQKLTSGDQSLLEDANKSKIPVLRAGEKSID